MQRSHLKCLKLPRGNDTKTLGDQQLATLIRSAAKPADERQREIESWVKQAAINQDPVRIYNFQVYRRVRSIISSPSAIVVVALH